MTPLAEMERRAVKLDRHGHRIHEDDKFNKPGVLWAGHGEGAPELDHAGLPEHIRRNLERARELEARSENELIQEPRAGLQTWEESLRITKSDGATITASATESIMVPLFTFPTDYFYPGRTIKWTLFGRQSTAITTPGTITFKLAYSATGLGAVTVVTSGAFAPDPTAAATNLTFMVEMWAVCRTDGTSGTMLGFMRIEWSDYDDASATALVGNLNMRMAPTSAPATASIDTTVARACHPTYTSSVGTASETTHLGILEAIS